MLQLVKDSMTEQYDALRKKNPLVILWGHHLRRKYSRSSQNASFCATMQFYRGNTPKDLV